ncbi:phosphatidylglycerophosphate synthase [Constrictibacter sp. MBR-5]|jgi:phosphatidylglycerophosphate synthase
MTDGSRTFAILGTCGKRLWGMTAEDRMRRAFARSGVNEAAAPDVAAQSDDGAIFVRAEYLIEERLIQALIATPGALLVLGTYGSARQVVGAHAPAGCAAAAARLVADGELAAGAAAVPEGLRPLTPEELGSTWNITLRKKAAPYVASFETEPTDALERLTFGASYKGATDFVTKYLWPWPARHVTRWCAQAGITPNAVTLFSLVLVFVTMLLFAQGHFLIGCIVGFFMTFLDTVDGKLARVTLTSSKWGEVFDHGIDMIHPPFWWWAWWIGLYAVGDTPPGTDLALWIIIAGYVIGRLLEGVFLAWFKIETFIWRPIDFAFRTITARRNPNLAILTIGALVGEPGIAFLLVALWTAISIAFHTIRLAQAAFIRLRGGEIRSWLIEGA